MYEYTAIARMIQYVRPWDGEGGGCVQMEVGPGHWDEGEVGGTQRERGGDLRWAKDSECSQHMKSPFRQI